MSIRHYCRQPAALVGSASSANKNFIAGKKSFNLKTKENGNKKLFLDQQINFSIRKTSPTNDFNCMEEKRKR